MLFPIKIKENSKNVASLISKRNEYISYKIPTLHEWSWNYLYRKGIDKASLKWRFERIPAELELTEETDETGEPTGREFPRTKTKSSLYNVVNSVKTFEDVYGKYKYNNAGIPAKINEYKSDILSREISAKVSSNTFNYNITNFFQKLLINNFIEDNNFPVYLDRIVEDVLVKNKAYLRVESFNLLRNVRVWDKIEYKDKNKWDYVWGDNNKLPYKRGVFTQYIDPECVFPEPNTKNPTEYFIAVPYTLNELLLNFPELASIKDKLYSEIPFPYKTGEDIEYIYNNYNHFKQGYGFISGNDELFKTGSWVDKLWNIDSNFYNQIGKSKYYWVWYYYHLASNPIDDIAGDYCCVFINNYELYSAPIPEADKSSPLICFEMNSSRDYYGRSMVSELKSIQEHINDLENIKKSQIGWLSTTNLAINKNIVDEGDFILDKHKINVVNLKTEDEESMDMVGMNLSNKQLSVGNVIQNLSIGNPQAVNLANLEIQSNLIEMDVLYPKPLYKLQLQPEQNQAQTSFSPVLPINTIIKQIGYALSVAGEKFVKENLGFIRFLNNTIKLENGDKKEKTNKILQAIGLDNLKIIVAKDEKEKQKIQDKKLIEIFTQISNQRIEQQRQMAIQQGMITGKEQVIKELEPKNIEKEAMNKIDTLRSEFSKYDDTTYFVFEDLIMLGTEDIDLKIKIGKTKEEILRNNTDFVNLANSMGAYIDNTKLLGEMATLYDINLDMLLANPPDSTTQQMLKNFRMNMLLYPDSTITQLMVQKLAGIKPEELVFNPNNSSISEWMLKTDKAKEDTKETTEETAKTQTKSKMLLEQQRLQSKIMNEINNVNPETIAKNQTSNFIPAPRPRTDNVNINPKEFTNKVPIPNEPNNQSLATERTSNPEPSNDV